MKAKRTAKSKSPARKGKSAPGSGKKSTPAGAKKRKTVVSARKKITKDIRVSTAGIDVKPSSFEPITPEQDLSPFSAITDAYALVNAWSVLGDEEYVLDDEIWNTLYSRIKLQLLHASHAFRIENEGMNLSPYASTPMPAFRSDNEPGYLMAGSFTILRPELPGVIFDLKISANDSGLVLDWHLRRKDEAGSAGHIALYLDGELIEAANLRQSQCKLELTREDLGDAAFYFLDGDSGLQTKILELNI